MNVKWLLEVMFCVKEIIFMKVMWHKVMWHTVMWHKVMWHKVMWHTVTWHKVMWHTVMWHKVMWHTVMWHKVMWHTVMWHKLSKVWKLVLLRNLNVGRKNNTYHLDTELEDFKWSWGITLKWISMVNCVKICWVDWSESLWIIHLVVLNVWILIT